MSEIVLHFTPFAELDAEANMKLFVELCRNSNVLNSRTQFDKNIWDGGHLKGHNTVQRLIFSTWEAAREYAPEPVMPQPFLDFAKAATVYLQDKRPQVTYSARLTAFRCLEAALRALNKGSRPTAVTAEVLDFAVELAKQRLAPMTAYRLAGQLKIISELLRTKHFIVLRQPWDHGQRKPSELGSRISKEALNARQKKLPSAAALRALAGIFSSATATGDIVLSSYCALMLSAPERINEALRLQRNCLVEGEGEFRGKLGVRWPGSKGFQNTTKWLPTEMVPVAREAVTRLLKLSAPAQKIAAWYTDNPGKLFIHADAKHLEGQELLTTREIALLLWGDEERKAAAWYWASESKKLEPVWLDGKTAAYRLLDVERGVLSMLPKTFPYVPGGNDLLCKDAIAITRTNEMWPNKQPFHCMFSCVSYAALDGRFCTSKDTPSIFERFGYTEDDGSKIDFRTHSLRHYLNMLAQTGGLSSTEIAIFSGRKDVAQNRAYDHMTSEEVQAPITEALKRGFTAELEPMFISRRNLVTRDEFKGLALTTAHTTEYGWCSHDFASEPCQIHRDCINCEEQECIKGEAHKEANLRQLKQETEFLMTQAKNALTDDEYGADAWVKHQSLTLERVNALLAILDDLAVPNGARIRLDVSNAPLITTSNAQPVKFVKGVRRKIKA